jgi:hypothetical protein
MRKPGMVTVGRAQRLLGVHRNTVYSYVRKAERGEPSPLRRVVKDPRNGYHWISLEDVEKLRRNKA